jgi:hypothetical protein
MNRKYTKELLEEEVKKCTSWRQLILAFSLKETGGNYKNLQKRCDEYQIDTSHFTGQGWNKLGHPNFGGLLNLEERFSLHDKKKASSKVEEDTFTQYAYACKQLGIQLKTSSVPEFKPRVI